MWNLPIRPVWQGQYGVISYNFKIIFKCPNALYNYLNETELDTVIDGKPLPTGYTVDHGKLVKVEIR